MKLSDRAYIIILIAMIIGLSLITYWRFKSPHGSFQVEVPPGLEMPKLNFDPNKIDLSNLNLGNGFPSETEEEKEWTSPDNKLRLSYPNNWMTMQEVLIDSGAVTGVMLIEEDILLFVYDFELAGHSFPSLTVSQISPKQSLEEIMEAIDQNLERSEGEKEVVLQETEDGITDLEIVIKYPGQVNFYSKGKIIFTEEKNYIIFFTVSQEAWLRFEEEAKKILDSVKLLE